MITKSVGYNLHYNEKVNRMYECSISKTRFKTDTRHKAIMTIADRKTYSFHPSFTKEEIFSFIKNIYKNEPAFIKFDEERNKRKVIRVY